MAPSSEEEDSSSETDDSCEQASDSEHSGDEDLGVEDHEILDAGEDLSNWDKTIDELAKPSPKKQPPAPVKQPRQQGGKEKHQPGIQRRVKSKKKHKKKRNKLKPSLQQEDNTGPQYNQSHFSKARQQKIAHRLAKSTMAPSLRSAVTGKKLTKSQKKMEDMLLKMQALEEENSQLKAKTSAKDTTPVGYVALNESIKQQCKVLGKDVGFRIMQFTTDDDELDKITHFCLTFIPQYADLTDFDAAEVVLRKGWVKTYRKWVNVGLNDQRAYVQGQLKLAYFRLMDLGKPLPTVDDLMRCAKREVSPICPRYCLYPTNYSPLALFFCSHCKIDVKKPEDYELMAFYWEYVLPAVASKNSWTKVIRKCTTPSQALTRSKFHPNKPVFLSSVEAFGILMVDNCWEKWPASHKWKKEHPEEDLPSNSKENLTKYPFLRARYTDSAAGQQQFSGLVGKGETRFRAIEAEIKTAQNENSEAMLAVEKAFLRKWRKEYHKLPEEVSDDEKQRTKKKKRRGEKAVEPGPKKTKRVIDFDL